MSDRFYNKLLINTNRSEGSQQLLLGYQHDSKELILKKDKETYFHVPYYTEPIALKDTSLILDGAVGASYPAAADRIFKNQKSYGTTTANGSPSEIVDGTWFCSWLYKDKKGNLRWLDRFYNPGTLKVSLAISQLSEGPQYEPNNPVFRDVPSKMIFEPGVMYRYYHAGEQTAQQLITTFGGVSSERLLLDLKDWGSSFPNISITSQDFLQPVIRNSGNTIALTEETNDVDRNVGTSFVFNNNQTINLSLNYDSVYCPTNEFTLALWAKSPSWQTSQTTQLAGNFSTGGGYGLFLHTLSSFPYFVIPETRYGHLLYINEENISYLDKSLQFFSGTTEGYPELHCVDMDHNVILCNSDNTGTIYKLDNIGEILCSTKSSQTPFAFKSDELPCELMCEYNGNIIVRTNQNLYTFDSNLALKQELAFPKSLSATSSFKYKKNTSFYELVTIEDVYDSKFIETTQWFTSVFDGFLYKKQQESTNEEVFHVFNDVATKFAIDPYDRIWVLHGNNLLTILDSTVEPFSDPLLSTNIGKDISHVQKNISFACQYDRSTNSREWRAIIYYPEEYTIFVVDIDGNLIDTVNIKSMFDVTNLQQRNQDLELLTFLGKGDFTGYEHKRVFQSIAPYNNAAQLVLKASLKDRLRTDLTFKQFKAQSSIANWANDSWQHLTVTLKNKTFEVFANGQKQMQLDYSGQYELSFETQPSFFIGSSAGSQRGYNDEVGYPTQIFNGYFEDIKIYDYAIAPNKLETFIKAAWIASDVYWSLPVPNIQYIEKVERMFKNKIPGSKSSFYQINLRGTGITDVQTKKLIEEQIKVLLAETQPAHVDFLRIHWVD
jgi:hypothetical protein